jgi:hypothetical protein
MRTYLKKAELIDASLHRLFWQLQPWHPIYLNDADFRDRFQVTREPVNAVSPPKDNESPRCSAM